MKKIMNIALCALLFVGCIAFTGCGKKSTADEVNDVFEAVADDAKDAAKDAEKAVKNAAEDVSKAAKDLQNK